MQHFNSGTNQISNFSRMKTIDHKNHVELSFKKGFAEQINGGLINDGEIHSNESYKLERKKKVGMDMDEREKSEMKGFIDFLCDSSPTYLRPLLTNSHFVLEVEYKRDRMNPIVAQYVFDLYKLMFENEPMSGYKVWAMEQQGDHKYGYQFHNTINEIICLYIKYMKLMTPNCAKLPIIIDKMSKRFHEYYGFSPRKE